MCDNFFKDEYITYTFTHFLPHLYSLNMFLFKKDFSHIRRISMMYCLGVVEVLLVYVDFYLLFTDKYILYSSKNSVMRNISFHLMVKIS